jgi:hypothetical protein
MRKRREPQAKEILVIRLEFHIERQESSYWLKVLRELYVDEKFIDEFEKYKNEANELRKIFASIKIASSK